MIDKNDSPRKLTLWLSHLEGLVNQMEAWAMELGWSTRRIEVPLHESPFGSYKAPALLFQEGVTRILLEPITGSAPGVEGVAELYLMPAYDDIASLYYYDEGWHLHYPLPEAEYTPVESVKNAASRPFTKESLGEVLGVMKQHVT